MIEREAMNKATELCGDQGTHQEHAALNFSMQSFKVLLPHFRNWKRLSDLLGMGMWRAWYFKTLEKVHQKNRYSQAGAFGTTQEHFIAWWLGRPCRVQHRLFVGTMPSSWQKCTTWSIGIIATKYSWNRGTTNFSGADISITSLQKEVWCIS